MTGSCPPFPVDPALPAAPTNTPSPVRPLDRDEPGDPPRLVGIHVYPFKSAAGIRARSHPVDAIGLRWDRHWMAVDGSGRFLSQRSHPRLALLRTALADDHLELTAPGHDTLPLPFALPDRSADTEAFHVWFQDRYAVDCGAAAADWISAFLGTRARVVRAVRPPDAPLLAPDGKLRAGFADAEPALVLSTASLDDLNRRLPEPVSMRRFRPNLVVHGVPPYGEERWGRVRIGDVVLRGIRPCPRCSITTVDPDTAIPGDEPLRTLARYRRLPDGDVPFGMNCGIENGGLLRVGAPVTAA